MEKTVNTAWYAKKCALGTLVCCGTELVLLILASALILRGAISEEMANGAVLVCARLLVIYAKKSDGGKGTVLFDVGPPAGRCRVGRLFGSGALLPGFWPVVFG